MLTAVLVTLGTLLVVGLAIFLFLRNRKGGSGSPVFGSRGAGWGKSRVQSIASVGVSAQAPTTNIGSGPASSVHAGTANANRGDLRSRFLAIGVLVGAAFVALTGKLFSMQILSSDSYRRAAEQNLYTTVSTPAPRGVVYDAEGIALITNRQVLTVLADADVADNHDVLLRLSALLGLPYDVVRNRILDLSSGAHSQRVVASDVSIREIAFITEHADAFPGVTTQVRTTRTYPHGTLAAHVLGYTGTASEEDLESATEGHDIEMGDSVGKGGVEAAYDDLLAGDHGQRVLVTDATGGVKEVISETDPSKGNDIYLTISARVQYVADQMLKDVVHNTAGTAASLVCMDVETGGILAMSSYPTFRPETFVGGVSQDVWDKYQTEKSHYPLLNRAISGTYPAASCFKAFTGLSGLAYGFIDSKTTFDCEGTWTGFGDEFPQKCWDTSGHGYLSLYEAIVVSCDVYFYEVARAFYRERESIGNDAMQDFIKEYGFAEKTGIELNGESEGRIPTPEWKKEYFADAPEEAQWLPGDMSNMVIGQGYVLVTPIQEARAYAAIATGNLLRPHLLKEVRNSIGEKVLGEETHKDAEPKVDKSNLKLMRKSLHGVATEDGTVSALVAKYDYDAAAKTGTAEVAGKNDFAWFCMYAPYDKPRYAISVCVEEGGGGAAIAAPIGTQVMDMALRFDKGKLDNDYMKKAGFSFKPGITDKSYTEANAVAVSNPGNEEGGE